MAEVLLRIIELQRKLEDIKDKLGNSQKVREQYKETMDKVSLAREAIGDLVMIYNSESMLQEM
jgi:hypothetical protein